MELFELDGLKPAPVSHGVVSSGTSWTDRAKEVIEGRIASYGGSEINFNLMAICADQVEALQDKIAACQAVRTSAAGGDTGTDLAGDKQAELIDLQSRLQEELAKRERWAVSGTKPFLSSPSVRLHHWSLRLASRMVPNLTLSLLPLPPPQFDNALRRHNHLGLVHALLVAMAKQGKLEEAVEESKKVMKERQDKARERAKMAGQM